MDKTAEEMRLPADVDAQPVVQAAAALRPVLRDYREEIEREQRMPPALVEQLREAGLYQMVIPRSLGGLQVDTLTFLRAVETWPRAPARSAGTSATTASANWSRSGLPDEGVAGDLSASGDTVIAGTAVPGGGQAVPVEGGYRVSGHWRFGSGCQEATWMLGSFQVLDDGQPRRHPERLALLARCLPAR